MKHLKILFPLLASVLLGACAGTSELVEGRAISKGEGQLSKAYVQAVENEAKKYAMRVFWVNPPNDKALQRYQQDSGR